MGKINSFELVVTDSNRKSELLISQKFEPFLLRDAIDLILDRQLSGFQVIKRKSGASYIRSKPNQLKSDNIDSRFVTKNQLWRACKDIDYRFTNPITKHLEKVRNENIKVSLPKEIVFVLRWDEVEKDYVIPTPSKTYLGRIEGEILSQPRLRFDRYARRPARIGLGFSREKSKEGSRHCRLAMDY